MGVWSAAELRCGDATDGLLSSAFASVLEVAALEVENLTIGPIASGGGLATNLSGRIVGGIPPYQVTVRWGDGTAGMRNLTTPGPFDWSHVFRPGTFLPRVTVVDSSGRETSAVVPQPVEVGGNASISVTASTALAEVGITVRFTGVVTGMPPNAFSRLSACGESSLATPESPPEIVCDPGSAGLLPVALLSTDGSVGPALTQTLEEPVAPALSVAVTPPTLEGEVGTVAFFEVGLSGGAPPFALNWVFGGQSGPGPDVLSEDGTLLLPVQPNATGLVRLSLTVSDADGATASVADSSLFVGPALSLEATAASSNLPSAAQVELSASVAGGIGPMAWVLDSEPTFGPGDSPSGWLPAAAGLHWSGTFPAEGAGTVELTVVDAVGALANETVPVELLPPLTGALSVSAVNASDGPGVVVNLNLSGGAPPFSVWINASSGAVWNATDPSDGVFEATVPVERAGASSVLVVAVDRLGGKVAGSTFVITHSSPGLSASPPGPSPLVVAVGVLSVLFVGAGAVLYLRHRRHPAQPSPSPEPEKVLEQILAPADGAERVTVELLAEEAGVPLETVRSTLVRLIATGKVRSEVSPDGEEVLAWSDPPPA